jgi:hypothetical protein
MRAIFQLSRQTRYRLLAIMIACFISLSTLLVAIPHPARLTPPYLIASASMNPWAYYSLGEQSMFNTLMNPAPCGSGLTTIKEAPSTPYNDWTDDAAKALGSLAYVYPNYATQANELFSYVKHNTVNGYLIQKCQKIVPQLLSNVPNLDAWNQLYYVKGDPTQGLGNSKQLFTVFDNENPTLAEAYIEGQVATINGSQIHLDTGMAEVLLNPGFDQVPLVWGGTGNTSTKYARSLPNSLLLTSNEAENQTIGVKLRPLVSNIGNLTLWVTSSVTFPQSYTITFTYTDGTTSSFPETLSASPTGAWQEFAIQGSQLKSGKTVKNVKLSTGTGVSGVYFDDVDLNVKAATPNFDAFTLSNGNLVMKESLVFNTANITMRYVMIPDKPYILVNTTMTNTATSGSIIASPQIYNAFDGLDTINSGYAWLYFPGYGWTRANQTGGTPITKNYMESAWNQNWFAISIHNIPDWIGSNAIFVDLSQANMPGGSGAFKINAITNTLFQNNTYTTNGSYLHWLEMSMYDSGNLEAGQSASYQMKYVFAISHDFTNMGVYSSFLDADNLDSWNNTFFANNYYYGEVANELAVYYAASGNRSYYNLASSVWNYYYRMVHAEANGTYPASLARFVNASSTLYKLTGNSTYLAGLKWAANLLINYQACCNNFYTNSTTLFFHYDPSITSTNHVLTFGYIFNTSRSFGGGRVLSGQSVNVGFFQNPTPQYNLPQNLSGTVSTTFYMNANSVMSGNYQTTLYYVTPSGSTTTIASSSNTSINLTAGSGNPPFTAFTSSISIPNGGGCSGGYCIPAGSTLEVGLSVSVGTGKTVYVCIDSSSNCRSSVTFPLQALVLWKGAVQVPPPQDTALLAAPQQQPYFLDLTAQAGSAWKTAYELTGNSTYMAKYSLAIGAIHWGDQPPGFKTIDHGIPSQMRLWSFANGSSVDEDFSTYKAMLVANFAEGINDTLANIAMSRVWDRVWSNTSAIQIETGESTSSHIEMNSETQPWGLMSWFQYNLYFKTKFLSLDRNAPLFANFANQHDVILGFSVSSAGTGYEDKLTVNGTGNDVFYIYSGTLQPSGASYNGGGAISFQYYSGDSDFEGRNQTRLALLVSPNGTLVIVMGTATAKGTTRSCSTSLPPTTSEQLERSCVFSAITAFYGGVLDTGGLAGGVALIIAALIFRKSEAIELALLILNVVAAIAAFLIPSPAQEIVLILFALAIAATTFTLLKFG